MIFHGILVLAILGLPYSVAQTYCKTPDDRNGTCIMITSCPTLLNIVQQKPVVLEDVAQLKTHACGFEGWIPKVCCTTPVTQSPPMPLVSMQFLSEEQTNYATFISFPNVDNHENLKLLNHDLCGETTAQKIFGGERTGVLDYPWMALLAYKDVNNKEKYRCGGTIINQRYVLTAAHCITRLPLSFTLNRVHVGDHNLLTERDCDRDPMTGEEIVCSQRYQDFGIESTTYHPQFAGPDLINDIGLIRVNEDIDYHLENVRPICLPIGEAAKLRHRSVVVTGWGTTEYGPMSHELLQVTLPIISTEECAEIYRDKKVIWYKQMCAGGIRGKDTCNGDSGGPLQAPGKYNTNAKYVQYGIVSYGTQSCALEGYPGVYTQVAYYTDWILDNMKK